MKAKLFKQATDSAHPEIRTNPVVEEALAKQAQLRGPKLPPKAMPVTPTLPKQPRPARERKKNAGKRR